jgi:DNA-binding NarL/FixJ family response regulator
MIVADHPIMCDGLRLSFRREADTEVACEVCDIRQLRRDFVDYKPDLAVVDFQLPQTEAVLAVQTLRGLSGTLPIVVLTTYPGEAASITHFFTDIVEVCKTSSGDRIVAAARAAALKNANPRQASS